MNFILRRITNKGEQNTSLGTNYNFITEQYNLDEFNKTMDIMCEHGMRDFYSDVISFIITENGQEIIPIYPNSTYYIMTESGQTFARL